MIISYEDLVIVVDGNITVFHNNKLVDVLDGEKLYKRHFSFEEVRLLYCVYEASKAGKDVITEINNLIFPFPEDVKISIDN